MAKKKISATLEQDLQVVVDKWYADNLHNSVVSRDTAVHNLLHKAKPALVKAIVAAVSQSTSEKSHG